MKVALVIMEGREQIVLTPESDLEKTLLAKLKEPRSLKIYTGEFYNCRGGWYRQGTSEESTIIVLGKGDDE